MKKIFFRNNDGNESGSCRPRPSPEIWASGARGYADAPEDIIAALTAVDDDLGRAVVRLAQPLVADIVPLPPAELSKYGDRAVIVVRPVAALEKIPGVTLVPLPDGRSLISLDESMSVHEFELTLRDTLAADRISARERSLLTSIIEILKTARCTRRIAVLTRNIIVLQSVRRGRRINF